MNLLTLYQAIRDGIAADSSIQAWAAANYDHSHKVYDWIDEQNPPSQSDIPYVQILLNNKSEGYGLSEASHGFIVSLMTYKEGTTSIDSAGMDIVSYDGVAHAAEFLSLVGDALLTAVAGQLQESDTVRIEYSYDFDIPYPFFSIDMFVTVDQNYYQGDTAFTW